MTLPFGPMSVLANTKGSNALRGNVRVLAWCQPATTTQPSADGETSDDVWLIEMPACSAENSQRRRYYAKGPYKERLSVLLHLVKECAIHVLTLKPDAKMSLCDRARLSSCKSDDHRKALEQAFAERDRRHAAILPLLHDPESSLHVPLSVVLGDPGFGARLKARANVLGNSPSTLYKWLHKYFAGGCQKNALLSDYDRCGNPGLSKPQRKKLGRPTRVFANKLIESPGYPLSDEDKEKLAHGYRLISHSTRPRDAYIITSATHWADHHIDGTGEVKPTLWPKHERPTFNQFMYWGKRLDGRSVNQMLLGTAKWRQHAVSKGGSELDGVVAIGQLSQFDGTSTDVYVTAYRSRLKTLPPMTRLVLKEMRSGVIYGLYCGWEPPSAQTALDAIRHGAMPSKTAWAARFGVTLPDGAIPGLLARSHLADNGELKGHKQTEAELQFGFGLDVAPTMSGDRKGSIESSHHQTQAHLDHRLPGSNRGKRRARGQAHAAESALLNYYEYMAELIRYVVWHNTEQEVPDLAPDAMLLADPPIRPTRINVYNWLVARRMDASIPVDYEALSAFTLPEVPAVVRKNGIYLKGKVFGKEVMLPRLRYTSPELVATGLLSDVKRSGSPINVVLKMDGNDLSQAWLPTKAGLIRLETSLRDVSILKKLTLSEWTRYREEDVLRTDLTKGEPEQQQAETLLRRMGAAEKAKAERAHEISTRGKAPPRVERIRDLDANRLLELEALRAQDLTASKEPAQVVVQEPVRHIAQQASSAAHSAMENFLQEKVSR